MDARTASADDRSTTASFRALEGLSSDTATRALAAACDIAMVIDRDGIIRDIVLGGDELADQGIETWLNRPWSDTVAAENRAKIAEMLAGTGEPGRWRQLNHEIPSGELPMRYLTIPANPGGGFVAIGRDMRAAAMLQQRLLRAQQAMERESLRLRQIEARYRLLFDSALEAVIVVDAVTRRITEANPAARRLADLGAAAIDGRAFTDIILAEDRDAATAMLGAVAAAEQRNPGQVRLADGRACRLSATLFRQDRGAFLLVRLLPFNTDGDAGGDRPLAEVLERMPDAFVLTDAGLAILASNGAFLDLIHQSRSENVRGELLSRFIGRPGFDIALLETQLREHASVRNFATIARTAGGEEDVEVSAVTSEEGGEVRHGFSIRAVSRRLTAPAEDRQTPRSVEQLTELVGRVSLKEIVRESTDLIERLCIEAALTYTADNRASAAEILGLSRQSLYSKLHRHGLGNLSDTD